MTDVVEHIYMPKFGTEFSVQDVVY